MRSGMLRQKLPDQGGAGFKIIWKKWCIVCQVRGKRISLFRQKADPVVPGTILGTGKKPRSPRCDQDTVSGFYRIVRMIDSVFSAASQQMKHITIQALPAGKREGLFICSNVTALLYVHAFPCTSPEK